MQRIRIRWPFVKGAPRAARAMNRRRRRLGTGVLILAWLYLATLIAVLCVIRFAGERWWPATIALFGPRWPWAAPWAALAVAALLWRRAALWILAVAGWVAVVGIMGFCAPWRVPFEPASRGVPLVILTCNTHARALNRAAMTALIRQSHADIVAMQEWGWGPKCPPLGGAGWSVVTDAELRLETRYPIVRAKTVLREGLGRGAGAWYEIDTPAGVVPLYNIHLASPHGALREAVLFGPTGASEIRDNSGRRGEQALQIAAQARGFGADAIVVGDFNMPPDSSYYRTAFATFNDAFTVAGFGFGYSYRAGGTLTRIDHILYNNGWACRRCRVGPSVGSPHRPVIAELVPD